MQELYTERNALRPTSEKTSHINSKAYKLLLDGCERHIDGMASRFPKKCPDGDDICGVDEYALYDWLECRIPTLLRGKYSNSNKPIAPSRENEDYDQFALLDYIEFLAHEMKTVVRDEYHSYFKHHHFSFSHGDWDFKKFKTEINEIFSMTGLLYSLSDNRQIERITGMDALVGSAEKSLALVPETGLRNLVKEAIDLYRKPKTENSHLATEKIWDALERLKTLYASEGLPKKESVKKLICNMADGNEAFASLFEQEFKALTDIGNSFRIRHHEIGKTDMSDSRYCDYFFNRCLSLVQLAIETTVGYY